MSYNAKKMREEREAWIAAEKAKTDKEERSGEYLAPPHILEMMSVADLFDGKRVEAPPPPPAAVKKKQRKKCPQTKLKDFFPKKTNGEGFPMKHCRYVVEEGTHVYFPPTYPPVDYKPYGKPAYCTSCRLCPCIMDGHSRDFVREAATMCVSEEMEPSEALPKLHALARKLMIKHFGRNYVRTLPGREKIPQCAILGCQERVDYLLDWPRK